MVYCTRRMPGLQGFFPNSPLCRRAFPAGGKSSRNGHICPIAFAVPPCYTGSHRLRGRVCAPVRRCALWKGKSCCSSSIPGPGGTSPTARCSTRWRSSPPPGIWCASTRPPPPATPAETAAREGGQYDLVVAAGGDGTLNEVISGLMRLDAPPPLGYLPQGTTNDFASCLKISHDPVEAARAIVLGPRPGAGCGDMEPAELRLCGLLRGLHPQLLRRLPGR